MVIQALRIRIPIISSLYRHLIIPLSQSQQIYNYVNLSGSIENVEFLGLIGFTQMGHKISDRASEVKKEYLEMYRVIESDCVDSG